MNDFAVVRAAANLVRHEECAYLFGEIADLRDSGDEEWIDLTRSDGEPLDQREMWNKVLEEALLVLDSRMTWLREA